MSEIHAKCPKCGGEMERGYRHAVIAPCWFRGMRSGFYRWLAMWKIKPIGIGEFRCIGCGYLESNARDEFAKKTTATQD